MSEIPIPANMDQVTPEWLTQVMASRPGSDGCRVIDRHIEYPNVEGGFISQLARITLEYEARPSKLPDSVIVKMPPLDATKRGISKSFGYYRREFVFYKFFAEDCPANPPRPYYANIDTTEDNFIVVIEDIGSQDPHKFFDGCTVAEAKSALRAIGGLHAKYWGERNLAEHDWVPRLSHMVPTLMTMSRQVLPGFTAKFGHLMPRELRDGLEYAAGNFDRILDAIQHLRDQTLCHFDAHLGNIAFENGRARIFDWQAFQVGSGSIDVASFINGSFREEADRRAALPELLSTYHEALVDGGVADFSRQDVEDHYHRQAANLWVLIPLLAGAFIGDGERDEIMAATWLPRIFSALEHSDAPRQLDIWLNEIGV